MEYDMSHKKKPMLDKHKKEKHDDKMPMKKKEPEAKKGHKK